MPLPTPVHRRPYKADLALVPPSRHSVFVRGLPRDASPEEIREVFAEECGQCEIVFHKVQVNGAFVVLRFAKSENGKKAIGRFNGWQYKGQHTISVHWHRDVFRYHRDTLQQKPFDDRNRLFAHQAVTRAKLWSQLRGAARGRHPLSRSVNSSHNSLRQNIYKWSHDRLRRSLNYSYDRVKNHRLSHGQNEFHDMLNRRRRESFDRLNCSRSESGGMFRQRRSESYERLNHGRSEHDARSKRQRSESDERLNLRSVSHLRLTHRKVESYDSKIHGRHGSYNRLNRERSDSYDRTSHGRSEHTDRSPAQRNEAVDKEVKNRSRKIVKLGRNQSSNKSTDKCKDDSNASPRSTSEFWDGSRESSVDRSTAGSNSETEEELNEQELSDDSSDQSQDRSWKRSKGRARSSELPDEHAEKTNKLKKSHHKPQARSWLEAENEPKIGDAKSGKEEINTCDRATRKTGSKTARSRNVGNEIRHQYRNTTKERCSVEADSGNRRNGSRPHKKMHHTSDRYLGQRFKKNYKRLIAGDRQSESSCAASSENELDGKSKQALEKDCDKSDGEISGGEARTRSLSGERSRKSHSRSRSLEPNLEEDDIGNRRSRKTKSNICKADNHFKTWHRSHGKKSRRKCSQKRRKNGRESSLSSNEDQEGIDEEQFLEKKSRKRDLEPGEIESSSSDETEKERKNSLLTCLKSRSGLDEEKMKHRRSKIAFEASHSVKSNGNEPKQRCWIEVGKISRRWSTSGSTGQSSRKFLLEDHVKGSGCESAEERQSKPKWASPEPSDSPRLENNSPTNIKDDDRLKKIEEACEASLHSKSDGKFKREIIRPNLSTQTDLKNLSTPQEEQNSKESEKRKLSQSAEDSPVYCPKNGSDAPMRDEQKGNSSDSTKPFFLRFTPHRLVYQSPLAVFSSLDEQSSKVETAVKKQIYLPERESLVEATVSKLTESIPDKARTRDSFSCYTRNDLEFIDSELEKSYKVRKSDSAKMKSSNGSGQHKSNDKKDSKVTSLVPYEECDNSATTWSRDQAEASSEDDGQTKSKNQKDEEEEEEEEKDLSSRNETGRERKHYNSYPSNSNGNIISSFRRNTGSRAADGASADKHSSREGNSNLQSKLHYRGSHEHRYRYSSWKRSHVTAPRHRMEKSRSCSRSPETLRSRFKKDLYVRCRSSSSSPERSSHPTTSASADTRSYRMHQSGPNNGSPPRSPTVSHRKRPRPRSRSRSLSPSLFVSNGKDRRRQGSPSRGSGSPKERHKVRERSPLTYRPRNYEFRPLHCDDHEETSVASPSPNSSNSGDLASPSPTHETLVPRGKKAVSRAQMQRVLQKKKELENAFKSDCETICSVTKVLLSKDPSLEEQLCNSAKQTLADLGAKFVDQLQEFIDSLSSCVPPNFQQDKGDSSDFM